MDPGILNNFFGNSNNNVGNLDILFFILALTLAATFSYILKFFYLNYWQTVSDKETISSNFILLTVIITIIISVVKSSLALSLGLVGALSIVRFRTPIKDPEELIFLFVCIALGLALGAFQFIFASLGLAFILVIIFLKFKFRPKNYQNNFFLTINNKNFDIDDFIKKSSNFFDQIVLKKLEENDNDKEIIFNMRLKKNISFDQFHNFLKENNIKNFTVFDQDNFFQP
jgi:hypothetical protein